MSRPNTTQRSWDNYVGDKPIESWKKKGFYSQSPRHSSDGDEDYIPEGHERDPITGKLKKKKSVKEILDDKPKKSLDDSPKKLSKSKLNEALDTVRGFDADDKNTSAKKPSWRTESSSGPVKTASKEDDDSMLPPGYTVNKDGRVLNSGGYLEPEDWYTIDEKTGKRRRKNFSERPVLSGQTDYNSLFS